MSFNTTSSSKYPILHFVLADSIANGHDIREAMLGQQVAMFELYVSKQLTCGILDGVVGQVTDRDRTGGSKRRRRH